MHQPYHLITSRFKFCNWPGPVGKENMMQSLCNLTIRNSFSDDVYWSPSVWSQRELTLLHGKDFIGLIERRLHSCCSSAGETHRKREAVLTLARPVTDGNTWHPQLFVPPKPTAQAGSRRRTTPPRDDFQNLNTGGHRLFT